MKQPTNAAGSAEALRKMPTTRNMGAWRDNELVRQKTLQLIRSRRIARKDRCEACGGRHDIQCHHPDYEHPEAVLWLCSVCHQTHHAHEWQQRRLGIFGRIAYRHKHGLRMDVLPLVNVRSAAQSAYWSIALFLDPFFRRELAPKTPATTTIKPVEYEYEHVPFNH